MAGRKCWPVCSITTLRRPLGNVGSGTTSYSIPCSSSARWTVQQGWAMRYQTKRQRCSLRATEDCGSDWGQTHSMREAPTMASEPSPNRTSAFPCRRSPATTRRSLPRLRERGRRGRPRLRGHARSARTGSAPTRVRSSSRPCDQEARGGRGEAPSARPSRTGASRPPARRPPRRGRACLR